MLGKMQLHIVLRILLNAECVKKNGDYFWWLVRAVPVLDKTEMSLNGLEHAPIYKISKRQKSNY
jgi:hypothetical protein